MILKQLVELLYQLAVVRAIFKYLTLINIFNNILNYLVDGLFVDMFDYFTTFCNIVYNKYRFDTIDKRFETIENDITDMKNKLDNIEVLLVQLLHQKNNSA